MSGRVVHFEIPYDDAETARAFYATVFGWSANPVPGMDYTLVATGPSGDDGQPAEPGFIDGGLISRSGGPSPAPLVVVDVEDIETTLAAVEAAGGATVQGRAAVGDLGFSAYVRDPEGNVVGLWQDAGRG